MAKVRFFKDQFNSRLVWGWDPKEGYVTEDSAEIENLKGLGLRHEPVEVPKKKTTKNKKAD